MEREGKEGVDFEELVTEAEQKFKQGIQALNQWGSQAREIIDRQPAAVLAGIAVLGFLTGLMLRRALPRDESRG
jgi:hypothetical protein